MILPSHLLSFSNGVSNSKLLKCPFYSTYFTKKDLLPLKLSYWYQYRLYRVSRIKWMNWYVFMMICKTAYTKLIGVGRIIWFSKESNQTLVGFTKGTNHPYITLSHFSHLWPPLSFEDKGQLGVDFAQNQF